MDYGGHDSAFHDNIVYNDKGGQACINTGGFLPGHGVHWYNNKCVLTSSKNLGAIGSRCNPGGVSAKLLGAVTPPGPKDSALRNTKLLRTCLQWI